jgi:hypothetical protein
VWPVCHKAESAVRDLLDGLDEIAVQTVRQLVDTGGDLVKPVLTIKSGRETRSTKRNEGRKDE